MTEIKKRGMPLTYSWESVLERRSPSGRRVPYTMTPEERAERKRAKKALKELKTNPWILWGLDGPELKPEKTQEWVPDE